MERFKRTYITKMPDKAGAFLKASRVISKNGGNIVRVNYNKSVDVHTLFIEVLAGEEQHEYIWSELSSLGYLTEENPAQKVILIVLKLQDQVGAVTPVLEIINNYDINVTYISSQENGTPYQYFKMGLLAQNAEEIKKLLEDISKICEVKILDYDITEKSLDNTVFYITFANEMREILNLNQEQTNAVLINSNRIMQTLDEKNLLPLKTFDYIKQFANFVVAQKGEAFKADIEKTSLAQGVLLYSIQPPCGSNTYILQKGEELLFVDCGFACYREEMTRIFTELFGDLSKYKKSIVITHADIDHTGLLCSFDKVYLSESCYRNFRLENDGQKNFRERNPLHEPYCKISKILSDYQPPTLENCVIIGKKSDDLLISRIGKLRFFNLDFEVFEGCGGHVEGEIIIVNDECNLLFTGDILVNPNGFSKKQKQFNLYAPYLMTSVNVDSEKAKKLREYVTRTYRGYTAYPGHGFGVTLE